MEHHLNLQGEVVKKTKVSLKEKKAAVLGVIIKDMHGMYFEITKYVKSREDAFLEEWKNVEEEDIVEMKGSLTSWYDKDKERVYLRLNAIPLDKSKGLKYIRRVEDELDDKEYDNDDDPLFLDGEDI